MQLWCKMWPLRIFHGTLRIQCDLKERGLWYELVFLAKICPVAEIFPANGDIPKEHVEKLISANESTPYPRAYLAQFFGVDLDWLEKVLNKLKDQGRIREDNRGIWIRKWEEYQSDYDRQAIYRKSAETSPERQRNIINAPICTNCGTDLDMERIKRDGGGFKYKCNRCGTVYEHQGVGKWLPEKKDEKTRKTTHKKPADSNS